MVREGAPCKLYFDLEFSKIFNPHLDGDSLTKKFIEFVCVQLKSILNIEASFEDVLVLDSSSATKYSVHLIFNVNALAFVNNAVCRSFVTGIGALDTASEFFVNLDDKRRVLFCDMQVYTKNRNFRLFLNTKLGKRSFFRISAIDRYVEHHRLYNIKDVFHRSLICLHDLVNIHLVSEDDLPSTSSIHRITCAQMDSICRSFSQMNIDSKRTDDVKIFETPTPFIKLDRIISSVIAPSNGRISNVRHIPNSKVLLYNFIGYKYCQNQGRNHKSNGVYFYVDLSIPGFAQKCFDNNDCPGYISPFESIPEDVAAETIRALEKITS